jgi:NAD(P)-dependent dehydrogenase (short-subunit alcohol dehydrogenase family)
VSEPREQTAGVVAISGARTGVGQATAQRFGESGWRVVIGGRRAEKLAETPRGYQYENLTVIPTAPRGELPSTFEAWGADVMSRCGAS